MPEEKGIVPNRRAYDTPVGPREMLGPYDVDFERLEMIERVVGERDLSLIEGDASVTREQTRALLNLIFTQPFSEEEFKRLIPLRVTEWLEDFFSDYERSSLEAANGTRPESLSLPTNSVPHSNGITTPETL